MNIIGLFIIDPEQEQDDKASFDIYRHLKEFQLIYEYRILNTWSETSYLSNMEKRYIILKPPLSI